MRKRILKELEQAYLLIYPLLTNNLCKGSLICKREIFNQEKLHYQANLFLNNLK